MQPAAQKVGPVSQADRILYIDMLRGMALFGILAANMRGFNAPSMLYGNIRPLFHDTADLIAQGFIDIFIQGKFVTLFSFLFGLGFAVQLSRAEARGARFLSFYPRRLAALALFGLIHGLLIWWGDILLSYALGGALLLLFRKKSNKVVLWTAGIIFALPVLVMTGFYIASLLGHMPEGMKYKPPDMVKIHSVIDIYAHGTVMQRLHENLVVWKEELPAVGFGGYALGLFLLGLWVWRSGIVEKLNEYKPLLKRVCAICLPLGLAGMVYVYEMEAHHVPGAKTTFPLFLARVLYFPMAHVLSAGYASGLALVIQNDAWKRTFTPFAAVGRMALTNYLTESVVCTLFYYSTGLYGKVGPAWGLIPTVVLYGAQTVFSNWWLTRYRFGPMEWLWRGMTYGKFPSMRKDEVESEAIEGVSPGSLLKRGRETT
jgi:uncharacterized protein